jgi:hypothetical protein
MGGFVLRWEDPCYDSSTEEPSMGAHYSKRRSPRPHLETTRQASCLYSPRLESEVSPLEAGGGTALCFLTNLRSRSARSLGNTRAHRQVGGLYAYVQRSYFVCLVFKVHMGARTHTYTYTRQRHRMRMIGKCAFW